MAAGVAVFLLRKIGRRTLLIYTMSTATILLFLYALVSMGQNGRTQNIALFVILVLFMTAFEFGPGPIGWIYMSEVMNDKGVAVGTFLNWTFCLIIGIITPIATANVGANLFFGVGATCGLGAFFVYCCVKETRGLTEN